MGQLPERCCGSDSAMAEMSTRRSSRWRPRRALWHHPGRELRWYRHDGWFNGAKVWTAGDGGRLVGTDWNRFEQVLPAADGVIYGITGEGELHWHRHTGWADGTDGWHPHSGARVGDGWNIFKTAFAMPGSDGTRPAPSPVQLALLSKHGPCLTRSSHCSSQCHSRRQILSCAGPVPLQQLDITVRTCRQQRPRGHDGIHARQ